MDAAYSYRDASICFVSMVPAPPPGGKVYGLHMRFGKRFQLISAQFIYIEPTEFYTQYGHVSITDVDHPHRMACIAEVRKALDNMNAVASVLEARQPSSFEVVDIKIPTRMANVYRRFLESI